jgi:hypothetical protein
MFLAQDVRAYSCRYHIGDHSYDSVEKLMQAIESHLAAKRPKPLTEEDVLAMRWTAHSHPFQHGDREQHNRDVDRLWSAVLAERAEIRRLQAELEAMR